MANLREYSHPRAARFARNPRKKLLIPDSAHGPILHALWLDTGWKQSIQRARMVDVERWARSVDEDVAALMITNPNTLGVSRKNSPASSNPACQERHGLHGRRQHERWWYHAARRFRCGRYASQPAQTFSTPRAVGGLGTGAVKAPLIPFLPKPRLEKSGGRWTGNYDRPQSIGRVRAFYGNIGMHVRALAYILAHRRSGTSQRHHGRVLNHLYPQAARAVL